MFALGLLQHMSNLPFNIWPDFYCSLSYLNVLHPSSSTEFQWENSESSSYSEVISSCWGIMKQVLQCSQEMIFFQSVDWQLVHKVPCTSCKLQLPTFKRCGRSASSFCPSSFSNDSSFQFTPGPSTEICSSFLLFSLDSVFFKFSRSFAVVCPMNWESKYWDRNLCSWK